MKARALFVDDEPLVLNGLRRMLRSLRHDWDMSFANSGQEGLELLEQESFDVVISDMRMPEMDGATFLGHVAERWPSVARLVLSGHAELGAILKAVRPAHQFLAKPCDPKLLDLSLRRISAMRQDHCQSGIRQRFGAHRRLPSPQNTIDQLREALQQSPADIQLAGKIVKGDIAMSVQVIRLVNSAFFGPPTKTFDPERAVSVLGPELLKSLVDDVQLFRPIDNPDVGKEEKVIEINRLATSISSEIASVQDGTNTEISADVLSMLSLSGSLAAIESDEELNDVETRTFSGMLLAFWGLDADIEIIPVQAFSCGLHKDQNLEAIDRNVLANTGVDA